MEMSEREGENKSNGQSVDLSVQLRNHPAQLLVTISNGYKKFLRIVWNLISIKQKE